MQLKEIIEQIKNENKWKSESRIVGEASEIYIKNNLYCIRCNHKEFTKCKTNEKSKDLICFSCNQKYQIKAKTITNKGLHKIISTNSIHLIGGEYSTTLQNLDQQIDYLILLYEKNEYKIRNILFIPFDKVNNQCIIPRKPLSQKAKRANWQGCYIQFNDFTILPMN